MTKEKKALVQYFEERNSCFEEITPFKSLKTLLGFVSKKSHSMHHIIIEIDDLWSEYEKGEVVSWSYPLGLHQV